MVSYSTQVLGWSLDHYGVGSLSFQIDGQPVTLSYLQAHASRPDVCPAHPAVGDPQLSQRRVQCRHRRPRADQLGPHPDGDRPRRNAGQTRSATRTFQSSSTSYVHLQPIADAWVNKNDPATNFGAATRLEMKLDAWAPSRHAYLKFDLSSLPAAGDPRAPHRASGSASFSPGRQLYA